MTTLQGVSSLAGGGCNYVTHYENSFSTQVMSQIYECLIESDRSGRYWVFTLLFVWAKNKKIGNTGRECNARVTCVPGDCLQADIDPDTLFQIIR